eukprot:3544024-Pleurochrysis_carterae.AAC.4
MESSESCETRRIASDEAKSSGEMPSRVVMPLLSTSGPMPRSALAMRAAASPDGSCRPFSITCNE